MSLAIISPFNDTVKQLQKNFLTDSSIDDITIETIDRIQGMTVDYAILYIPGRNPGFALDERRFNVATSRSRSTTLIISDIPLKQFHTIPSKVIKFIEMCKTIRDGEMENKTDPYNKAQEDSGLINETTISGSGNFNIKIIDKIDLSQFETPKQKAVKSDTKENFYIIDTNVFVNCPGIISKIDSKYKVVMSAKVIDELDRLKIRLNNEEKQNVEVALRLINKAMDRDNVSMELSSPNLLPDDFDKKSPDNNILTVALKFKNENPILLTSDNGLQIKAKGLGIKTITLKEFLKK